MKGAPVVSEEGTNLQELGDGIVDDHQGRADEVNHPVLDWDVGLHNLSEHAAHRVLSIPDEGVALHVDCNNPTNY